ncbi:MAG: transglycosylase SLT domain-containing protein [Proteobacteria bacterium]|nr:transglycosylase SLT domain-containing protein [Pseudomonadota bacterium]
MPVNCAKHRGVPIMRRLSIVVVPCLLLTACAGQPPHSQTMAPDNAVAALYARLDADTGNYLAARGAEAAPDKANAALDDLQAAAAQCATTRGCDNARFLAAFDKLLRAPVNAPPGAADAGDDSPDAAVEAGETSPVVAALPQAGRSVALLKGHKLADIIAINDPMKVAIEQWLTQYRPNLMRAWENYQYLRHEMWPQYEKAGLPEALLFGMLAQESGGKVHAVSRSGASGPLQFMSATGARFGLGVVNGFDQRFDPAQAARANAAYINEQLGVFNDNLELAVAAYNGGEGAMQRLAQRNPDQGFWSPKIYFSVSQETRDYVPMVLAAAWLFLHPERYNLQFPKVDTVPAHIALKLPASIDELTVCLGQDGNPDGWFRTLRNLNPAWDPRQKLAAGTPLDVPASLAADYEKLCTSGKWVELAADLHAAAEPVAPARPARPEPKRYVVRRGDTLGSIARRNGCSSGDLARLNHLKPPHFLLQVGQGLRIDGCRRE